MIRAVPYSVFFVVFVALTWLAVADFLAKKGNAGPVDSTVAEDATLGDEVYEIALAREEVKPEVPRKSQSGPAETRKLSEQQRQVLTAQGWNERIADRLGVWVSIREQIFRIVQNGRILWETKCSTAANGPGAELNSYKTPLGWHSVVEKYGDNAPWGLVFREKRVGREVWHRGDKTTEDLVLTRLLALTGEEPGKNKGGNVDSYARGIYIHGTNDEENIGKPKSHGCVRLTNDDVIPAYDKIPIGTLVLITP